MIQNATDAVRVLAADDVSVGDYLVVMNVTLQIPSFYWSLDYQVSSRTELVHLSYMPGDCGSPLEVIAVCLPFLLVETFDGTRQTKDLRQCRVARVSPEFASKVRKSLAKNKKRKE